MQKFLRLVSPILFVTSLLSCDLFFLAKGGRYNPQDPKNVLEWVEVVVPLKIDGYIDSGENRDFDGPLLRSDWVGPDIASILLFDRSKLPVQVVSATLEMYTTINTIGMDTDIYVVGQSWTPSTLRWMPFFDGTIVDWDCLYHPVTFPLTGIDNYNAVDITDLMQYIADNNDTYGIFFAWGAPADYIEFYSSRGPHPPILTVTGWAIPE